MNSSSQDASRGQSRPGEGSAKQSKRPKDNGRHSSSWIRRLHRHQSRNNQPSNPEAERPLLANDYPGEDDEEAQIPQPSLPLGGKFRLYRFLFTASRRLKKAVHDAHNFWARNPKQILLACVLALLALLVSLSVSFYFHHTKHEEATTCESPACVHAAAGILENLDPDHASLDACIQFDQMVCGGWQQRHDLRPDQSDIFTGTMMAEASNKILRHILEQNSSASTLSAADQDNFNKLKDDYDACMNEEELQEIGLKPLQDLVGHVKMHFPSAIDLTGRNPFPTLKSEPRYQVNPDGTDQLTDTLLFLTTLDIGTFLQFYVEADERDPDSQVLMVFPPNLGLPSKEYYEDETIVRDYQNMTATVLGQFFDKLPGNTTFNQYSGSKMSLNKLKYSITPQTDMEDLVQGVVDFEVKLAAATPATQNMQVVTQYYNPMTIAEVEALLPQVSLNYLISQLASREYSPKKIIVASPSYMTTLADLLSSTKKETLQAFLVWRTIQRYEGRVADPSLQPLRTFNSQLRGLDPSATGERWRTCVNAVRSDLGWILSKFFVESAFSEEAKKFGDQIVSDIKDSFTTILDNSEWMTRNVRDRAINKVHAINQKIGYPTSNPNVLDPVALKRYYSDVTISNSTFFENRVQVVQFEVRRAWNKLGKPTQRDEWSMTVPEVNAYYYPPGNEIVFPAGIMQAPVFYDPSVPHYLTFGAYGAIAGHELSHAFDSSGSHYDETGNYTDWFDQATKQAFDTKTQCFVNQFAHYTVTSPDGEVLHVNGNLTLAENIADSGGLNVAFMAWKKREAQAERPSLALPGLKMFSHEQLFFISYANWWCDKSRPETAVQRIYTDPHSPKWVRILGTVNNSADFKKAFQCGNVEPACKLW